ncbi:MAG: hypothetical protein JW700_00805 [Candidatus Aenigmarchaeota archaeon]|nr:hypothetical protein [Candidatus Aenigmarchaeota archaeon]
MSNAGRFSKSVNSSSFKRNTRTIYRTSKIMGDDINFLEKIELLPGQFFYGHINKIDFDTYVVFCPSAKSNVYVTKTEEYRSLNVGTKVVLKLTDTIIKGKGTNKGKIVEVR